MRIALTLAALILAAAVFGGGAVAGHRLLTGRDIQDHSIGLNDLSRTAIAHLRGARGPQGEPGPQGEQGTAGGFDPAKVSHVTGPSTTYQPGDVGYTYADCPAGTRVIGGGYFANVLLVAASEAFPVQNRWGALIANDTGQPFSANATAVCAAP